MPNYCLVVNCGSNSQKDKISFFRIPSIFDSSKKIDPRKERRRDAWIAALKRDDLDEKKLKYGFICANHFITGKPAKIEHETDLDWIPNLNMDLEVQPVTGPKTKRRKFDMDSLIWDKLVDTSTDTTSTNQTEVNQELDSNIKIKEEVMDDFEANVTVIFPPIKEEVCEIEDEELDIKEEVLSESSECYEEMNVDGELEDTPPQTEIEAETCSDMIKLEPGFVKAYAGILPIVTMDMIHDFYVNIYLLTKLKWGNNSIATDDGYGDQAIQFVQILREDDGTATLKCKIKAKEKADVKYYNIRIIINERNKKIEACECMNCSITKVGCKHAVAVLYWLYRKYDQPIDEEESYWISRTPYRPLKPCTMCKDFGNVPKPNKDYTTNFLSLFLENAPMNCNSLLLKYNRTQPSADLHKLMIDFVRKSFHQKVDNFLDFYHKAVTKIMCNDIYKMTTERSEALLKQELRYGRITCSLLYEASHSKPCKKLNDKIFGNFSYLDPSLTRSQEKFKKIVIQHVEKLRNITIVPAGLRILSQNPIFAACTDGISEEYCILIKCPLKKNKMAKYIVNDKIKEKCYCELMLQLHFYKKQKGLLCVAAPNFLKTKIVHIIEVTHDQKYLDEKITKASRYWREEIYPILLQSCHK